MLLDAKLVECPNHWDGIVYILLAADLQVFEIDCSSFKIDGKDISEIAELLKRETALLTIAFASITGYV